MPEIIKTNAIVIKKINFGDTSQITTFYTPLYGKLSGILKGARSGKSKLKNKVDLLNYLEIVIYRKESRDIQIVSQADLISAFPRIKEDLEKLKFASAIVELLLNLTSENEKNERLFRGSAKALDILDSTNIKASNVFAKYLYFFIKEIGYDIQVNKCSECDSDLSKSHSYGFKFDQGILCENCKNKYDAVENITSEHFRLLNCLNSKNYCVEFNQSLINKMIYLMEKYLVYHIPEFKGIKSIYMY